MNDCEVLNRRYVVLDGGTSTEICRLGYEIQNGPLWSAQLLHTNPDTIKEAHKNFLRAGSDIIETCSYQSSVQAFVDQLNVSAEEATKLISKAALVAKEAVKEYIAEIPPGGSPTSPVIAGSLGPYGVLLHDGSEYSGNYFEKVSVKEIEDFHRSRISALLDGNVDIITFETVPGRMEAEIFLDLIQKEFPNTKVCVSFSCKDELHTSHGETLAETVGAVWKHPNVLAVGVNCTAPRYITSLLNSLKPLTITKPISVRPNSGQDWDADQKRYYGSRDSIGSSAIKDWLENGATWIGGCCLVYPDDIRNMKSVLETFRMSQPESNRK